MPPENFSEEEFSKLYDLYLPKIFGYVSKRICDRAEAEDITSNIFLKVVEKISTFDSKRATFKTWIYMIATRTIIDHLRVNAGKKTSDVEEAEKIASGDATPHESAKKEEDRQRVFRATHQLKDKYREALMLRFWGDLSLPELALALEVSENNASVILHRALQDFKITYERNV